MTLEMELRHQRAEGKLEMLKALVMSGALTREAASSALNVTPEELDEWISAIGLEEPGEARDDI